MIFNTLRIKLVTLGCVILITLSSWKLAIEQLETPSVFDEIRPSYELMEFISRSVFVDNYRSVHDSLAEDLRKKRINLLPSASDNIKVGTGNFTPHHQEKVSHFASPNQSYWIDIIEHDDGEVLFDDWKAALSASGLKADIRNDEGGSVFVRVQTKENSVVGALFYTGRNVFNIGIKLPFPIPQTYNELDSVQQLTVRDKLNEVYTILETIAHRYVAPHEFVFYPTQGKPLTREQRLYGLVQFWTEVKYNFAFFDQVPDLNWDEVLVNYLSIMEKDQTNVAYYRHMEKLCALLKDGHTNIDPPPSVEATFDYPAVTLINIQHKAIVENVAVSLQDDIPIGSEVLSVEEIPTDVYLQDTILPYISASTDYILLDWGIRELLKGKKNTLVKISVKKPNGGEKEIVLKRNRQSSNAEWVKQREPWNLTTFKRLPNDIAYVALNSFGSDEIVQEFSAKIDTINTCKGLILDLRENGGGDSDNAHAIITHLTDKPFFTSKWKTREHRAAFKAWGKFENEGYRSSAKKKENAGNEWEKMVTAFYEGDQWYTEAADTIVPPKNKKVNLPMVVLIGHNTASAAEDFLIALDQLKIATLLGEKTFGSTGQPLFLDLPGGGSARICTKRDTYPDGKEFVGYGIEPHIYVENTVEDFLEGNDPVLTRGVDMLTSNKN